ncbi:MAG TPA: choice-of-anchor Q domain-containing protein [Verrucomicrobiae bacterium]|nr:choice-of-anchor Q domain-containing protein [Verrucomicrobiae bacterium]
MNKRTHTETPLRALLFIALCFAACPAWSNVVAYSSSSATQLNNTISDTAHAIFTATGFGDNGGNGVNRCTAVAVDSSAQKIFILDGGADEIWSINFDGSGLTGIASTSPGTPTDLALDTVHQQIYFTTSSFTQSNNTIQQVSYAGGTPSVLFTASNGVGRCTGIALNLAGSQILFSDAGSNAIWSIPLGGGSLTSLAKNLPGAPLDLTLDAGRGLIYFVTSSTIQGSNTVEEVSVYGSGAEAVIIAGDGNAIERCTGLEFDPSTSMLYLSDAGANTIWSTSPPLFRSVAAVETRVLPTVKHLALLPFLEVAVLNLNDSGPGSLRQTILTAPANTTIIFSNGLFSSKSGVVNLDTISDSSFGPSAIIVTNRVSILGPAGSNGIIIARSNGAPAMRLFLVEEDGSLTLENLTISNGFAQGGAGGGGGQRGGSGGGGAGMGGAILNFGTLNLGNSTFAGNEAIGGAGGEFGDGEGSGGGGGGMDGPGGVGGMSAIGGNGGPPSGGNGGTNAGNGFSGGVGGGGGGGGSGPGGNGGFGGFGGGGGGGGAWNTAGFGGGPGGSGGNGSFGGGGGGPGAGTPSGSIGLGGFGGGNGGTTFDNSGNFGSAGGGGAGFGGALCSIDAVTTITNCTFSGNVAEGGLGGTLYGESGGNGLGLGGAMFTIDSTLDLLNSTFAYNQADKGGGICNAGADEVPGIFIRNTILAETVANASDYLSTNLTGLTNLDLGNNNLIQVNDGFAGGIVSTANPRLTPFQDNGGPTLTYALLNGSPAIDAGDNTGVPDTDQRGYPRVVESSGGSGPATVDLGAVENGLVRLTALPQTPGEITVNGLEMFLTGETNRTYVVESSSDLLNWSPISTNLIPPLGVTNFFDTGAYASPYRRFYRDFALPSQ